MSKGERLRGQRATEALIKRMFRNADQLPRKATHTCQFDQQSRTTEVCHVCQAWWEPTGGSDSEPVVWQKVNRDVRRARLRAMRKSRS